VGKKSFGLTGLLGGLSEVMGVKTPRKDPTISEIVFDLLYRNTFSTPAKNLLFLSHSLEFSPIDNIINN
jgi:hypothetical protein